MKKGYKYFLLLAVMVFSVSAFTFVHFTDTAKALTFEYDESNIASQVENMTSYFPNLSDAELEFCIKNSVGVNKEAFESIQAVRDEGIGKFVSAEECKVKEYDDYITADAVIHFEKKDVKLKVKFQYLLGEVSPVEIKFNTISDDKKVSLGSKMATAGLNTVMGIGTVVVVLIFLSLIISIFGIIHAVQNKKEDTAKAPESSAEETEEELMDDLELVAVITAAIAASENGQAGGFVVRSIKRSPQNRWKNA